VRPARPQHATRPLLLYRVGCGGGRAGAAHIHTAAAWAAAERAQAALTADLRAREGELRDRAEQLAAEAGARAREREAAARGMRELEARVLASVRADFEAAARDSQI